jgi:hypothetical protein
MKKKLTVPKFTAEAEEAKWWDEQRDVVEENLIEAIEMTLPPVTRRVHQETSRFVWPTPI